MAEVVFRICYAPAGCCHQKPVDEACFGQEALTGSIALVVDFTRQCFRRHACRFPHRATLNGLDHHYRPIGVRFVAVPDLCLFVKLRLQEVFGMQHAIFDPEFSERPEPLAYITDRIFKTNMVALVLEIPNQAPRLQFPVMISKAPDDSTVRSLPDEISCHAKPRSRTQHEVGS